MLSFNISSSIEKRKRYWVWYKVVRTQRSYTTSENETFFCSHKIEFNAPHLNHTKNGVYVGELSISLAVTI